MKQFEYKGGIATRLQNNNPEGFNRFKKNPQPKPEEKEITKEDVQQAYRNKLKAKSAYLSASQIYSELNSKFVGLDIIDKEMKE